MFFLKEHWKPFLYYWFKMWFLHMQRPQIYAKRILTSVYWNHLRHQNNSYFILVTNQLVTKVAEGYWRNLFLWEDVIFTLLYVNEKITGRRSQERPNQLWMMTMLMVFFVSGLHYKHGLRLLWSSGFNYRKNYHKTKTFCDYYFISMILRFKMIEPQHLIS